MKRAGSYLGAAARSLRMMQLPAGELSSVHCSESGETFYAPAPLLSALAYDALAYVDPRSAKFVGRVRELVPQSFFVDVVSLRWGLRLFLASEQSADGTWQLHGRLGSRGADVATTACAAIAMLPSGKGCTPRADRRHLAALQRLGATNTLEAAHAARYCALIGANAEPFLERIASQSLSIFEAHALAATGLVKETAALPDAPKNTLAAELRIATMLDVGDESLDLRTVIDDHTPPSQWAADPYGEHRIASPAAALAIRIGNVARLTALPHGEAA